MKELIVRTITGIMIVVIVMGSIILHPLSFILLWLFVLTGIQVELSALLKTEGRRQRGIITTVFSVSLYILSVAVASGLLEDYFMWLALLPALIIPVAMLYRKGNSSMSNTGEILFSVIYTSLPFVLMNFMAFGVGGRTSLIGSQFVFSPWQIAAFFALVWINDTAAYLNGVTLGRHRLFERISPAKSWEGFAGGVIFTAMAAYFIGKSGIAGYGSVQWLSAGIVISAGSTLGDLFESLIKREAGVKDSGSIMPGHGGLLDRFDGVMIAFPLVYLFFRFFG